MLNTLTHLDEGAGQYRPYSRLGLFCHYASPEVAVRASIAHALDNIVHPDAISKVEHSPKLQRLNYAAEMDTSKRNIYIIGSLAGGTGSGLFLDISRIVRSLDTHADLVAFFLTSKFFPMATQRMHANTYAALLEWEYYNTHRFYPTWSNTEVLDPVEPPLFNYSYIIDSPNAASLSLGARPDDQKRIYEIVAENVFKDFSHGRFAQKKRSVRANVIQFIAVPSLYPPVPAGNVAITPGQDRTFRQKLNRHFQTFGLASISVPHDRIITACAHRLAADLVLYWKGLGAEDANIPRIVEEVAKFLPSAQVQLDADSMLARLDDASGNAQRAAAGGTCFSQIFRFCDKLFDQAKQISAAERPDHIATELDQFRAKQLAPAAPGEDGGLMLRTFGQNAKKLVIQGIQSIENRCAERLDVQKLSVSSTILFAERICEVLEGQLANLRERKAKISIAIEQSEAAYNAGIGDLRAHVYRHNVDFRKQTILEYDMMRLRESILGQGNSPDDLEQCPGLLLGLRQKALVENAMESCSDLISAIHGERATGALLTSLRQLDRTFDTTARVLREDASYFEEKHNEDLSLVLFEMSDILAKYYKPPYVTPETIKSVADRARDEEHLTAASINDTDFLRKEGGAGRIIDLCRKEFENIRHDFHVIDVFFELYGGGEGQDGQPVLSQKMETELKRVFQSAMYWGQGGTSQLKNYVPTVDQIDLVVGLPEAPSDGATDRLLRRRNKIKDYLHDQVNSSIQFEDVPETSEIIFYTELAGVPLTYFTSMYELRSVYRQLQPTDRALHLESKDVTKFEDALILTDEELRRLQSAWSCIVGASIFGEIWVKAGTDNRIEYGYSYEMRGLEQHPRIGNDDHGAVIWLQMHPDIVDMLMGRTTQPLKDIVDDLASSDTAKQTTARRSLVQVSAIVLQRMQALSTNADQGDWRTLPLHQKMEFLALDKLNERLDAMGNWGSFSDERKQAIATVAQFATRRTDGRYQFKPVAAPAGQ